MSSARTGAPVRVSEEVAAAVAGGRPVVALESTIFTHGLPRPRNLEVALEGEERLRSKGVVPATIGVFAGIPTVGLSLAQITSLANEGQLRKSASAIFP
jgi:pseudouridine-5'-phosphate glycosidase